MCQQADHGRIRTRCGQRFAQDLRSDEEPSLDSREEGHAQIKITMG